jgi:hydroxymethylbilane synthase
LKALRIGTRGSALALWQARSISEALRGVAGVQSELVIVKTSGDKFQQTSFSEIGTREFSSRSWKTLSSNAA